MLPIILKQINVKLDHHDEHVTTIPMHNLHMENSVISHYTGALGTIRCSLEEPNLGLRQNYLRGVKIRVQLQPMRAGLAEPDERHQSCA